MRFFFLLLLLQCIPNSFAAKISPPFPLGTFLPAIITWFGVTYGRAHRLFPPEIGNLTNLQQLYLGHYNGYTGGIPLEIGNLSSLIHLDAANCGLSDEVPSEIEKLQNRDTVW
ncbi:unnamed protein product [Lactuca saligna]|uniref:Leucine-rich repeat-containing N-terminal plant-type domain-containing protein n=1 Tax=Lactuca saligna TaxID=75948 RepID=A0AA35YTC2_LACSI|nr:unnamed protein product [Lactuca saligna]